MRLNGFCHSRVANYLLLGLIALAAPVAYSQPGNATSGLQTPPPISGRSLADPESILPADALARVELIRANLELIRKYMGKTQPPDPVLQVSAARPRETYSQALNLELRANRLAFEQTRQLRQPSQALDKNVRAYDVFQVVDSVLAVVLAVKAGMGIQVAVVEQLHSPTTTVPADVFNATVAAGSEINNLLYQRTGPSDVFQTVTSAVHIAASLHMLIPDHPSLPMEPTFEPNKSPYDVFMRMRSCFELISTLAQQQGIEMLEFDIPPERALLVRQNDVSDMAFLLLEELNGIYRRMPDAPQTGRAFYPGKKFAAHVFQRVGLLEQILQDLVAAHMMTTAAGE